MGAAGSKGVSLAARLENQGESVVAAVASSLASLRFFAGARGGADDPVDVLARVPGLARVFAERAFELTPQQYRAVLVAVEKYPGQVDDAFASAEMVNLVAENLGLAPVMNRVEGLGAVLAVDANMRQWLETSDHTVLSAIAIGGPKLLGALRTQPALLTFLAGDDGTRLRDLASHPWLIDVLRKNQVIALELANTSTVSGRGDPALWTVLTEHHAFALTLRPADLRALMRRQSLLTVLSTVSSDDAAGTPWRAVLSNGNLLELANAEPDFARLLFTDAEVRTLYLRDQRVFTLAARRVQTEGGVLDVAGLRRAVQAEAALAQPTAKPPVNTTEGSGETPTATPPASTTDRPPRGGGGGRKRGGRGGRTAAAAAGTARPAESTQEAGSVGLGGLPKVAAADQRLLAGLGGSEDLRLLLESPGREEVLKTLVDEPHVLALFEARPDIVAAVIDDPQRIEAYRFGAHVRGDGERDFETAFADFISEHDLELEGPGFAAVHDQARVSWSKVREQHQAERLKNEQERQSRIADLNAGDERTWHFSGKEIRYGKGLGNKDFTNKQLEVLSDVARGQGVREARNGRIRLHAPLHAHLDGGDQGVTFTYVLNADGEVEPLVYAVSKGRSDNKYRWGGGVFRDGPAPLLWIDDHPSFVASEALLADRSLSPAPAMQEIALTGDEPVTDSLAPVRQAILDYYVLRHKELPPAPATASGSRGGKRNTGKKPAVDPRAAQEQAVAEAGAKLRGYGLDGLLTDGGSATRAGEGQLTADAAGSRDPGVASGHVAIESAWYTETSG